MGEEQSRARAEQLLAERSRFRALRAYEQADALRRAIEAEGFAVRDTARGSYLERIAAPRTSPEALDEPPAFEISVHLLAEDWLGDTQRCLASVECHRAGRAIELVVVDNASPPASQAWLDSWSAGRPDVRVVRFGTRLGYAAARNAGLRWAQGYVVVFLDTSVELTGDAFGPLLEILRREAVGAAGAWGVRTPDLRRFNESEEVEVDALEGYCFAFLRERLREIGFLDEKFRYYRNCDLDYSFAFRARGYRLCRVPELPLIRHEHRGWTSLPEAERDRLSKRNFYHFLEKWRDRADLLVDLKASGTIATIGAPNRG